MTRKYANHLSFATPVFYVQDMDQFIKYYMLNAHN